MRQDMRERQRQLRKLHESIEKYTQSPSTKKSVQKAAAELAISIQAKFARSEANRVYVFPKRAAPEPDEYDECPEVVDLRAQNNENSRDLSIADEPESNHVYISQKTVLSQEKYLSLFKQEPSSRSKMKIKVVKRNKFETCEAVKLDRLKTEHIYANFSTLSINKEQPKSTHNDSCSTKSKYAEQAESILRKIKICTKRDTNTANITMKTEYPRGYNRKQNKENDYMTRETLDNKSAHYIPRTAMKKVNDLACKSTTNLQLPGSKKKDLQNTPGLLQATKKYKIAKSYENLKSIRLCHTSMEKIKAKGLHA